MQKQKEGVNTLTIQMVLANVNEFLYSNILLALLIGTGIYFTIRTDVYKRQQWTNANLKYYPDEREPKNGPSGE